MGELPGIFLRLKNPELKMGGHHGDVKVASSALYLELIYQRLQIGS